MLAAFEATTTTPPEPSPVLASAKPQPTQSHQPQPQTQPQQQSHLAHHSHIVCMSAATDAPHNDTTTTTTGTVAAVAQEPKRSDDTKTMFRVKLYELNPNSTWDDKGTGFCEIVFVEMRDALCIVVKSEEDGRKLLESVILHEDVYRKQEDTLLAWTEPDGTDLALSFQDMRGCSDICENIQEIQRRLNGGNILMNMKDDFDDEIMDTDKVELPELTLDTLPEFDEKLGNYLRIYALRDSLVSYLQSHQIIEKLCELFETAEDMEMLGELIKIFSIMRSVVATNNATIFERVLKEDVIMQFCGIFEYDPEYHIPHGQHRRFLKEGTNFQEVVAIKDEQILQKIHQTFRAQFLKDVVLARVVEEAHYSILSSIVMFNQIEILNSLGRNEEFLKELFAGLRIPDVPLSRKSLILRFIQDFCVTAKSLQMVDRQVFYRSLAVEGIFQELIPYLRHPDRTLKLAAADILQSVQDYDTSLLRSFIVAQIEHDTRPFIEDLLELLVEEHDPGLQMQYNEMFKALFDAVPGSSLQEQKPEAAARIDPAQASQDTEHFLEIFFSKYFTSLVQPIIDLNKYVKVLPNKEKVLVLNGRETNVITHFMDILGFLSRSQIVRAKFPIASNDIIHKVGLLFYCKNDSLKIVAVKFLRGLIETKDDFYSRHLIKHDLLSDFIEAFSKNGRKYNLFNSVGLSLFEYIRDNNLGPIIKYLVEKHRKALEAIDYVDTGLALIKLYESADNDTSRSNTTTTEPSGQRAWNAGDEKEDAYFDEIDEEPSMTSEQQEEEEQEPEFLRLRPKVEDDDDDAFERMTTGGKRLPGLSPNITVRGKPSSPTPQTPRKIVFNSSLRNAGSAEPKTPPPSKGLVDYDDDPTPANSYSIDVSAMRNPASELLSSPARPFSPVSDPLESFKHAHSEASPTPTKIQNLLMGAKRMALDSPSEGNTIPAPDDTLSPVPATISPSLLADPESPFLNRDTDQRAPGSHKKIRLKE